MKSHQTGFVTTIVSVAMLAGGSVLAHEGAMGVTAERMTVMKDMASHMKALEQLLEQRATYDALAARDHAFALYENCHKVAAQFPAARSHDHHSRAAPAVWEQPERFKAETGRFERVVTDLVSATTLGQRDTIKARFADVGRACSGCHETFRLPER